MALDFTQTADDDTLIRTLRPLIADKMWHDGITWWSKQRGPNGTKPTWAKTKFPRHWHLLHAAGLRLPNTPYWARSKHRLAMAGSARQIALQLAVDCWTQGWPKPTDLAS